MPQMFLIFNHTLTENQKKNAKKVFKIEKFLSLPKDLQALWSNVPPDITDLKNYLKPLISYLKNTIKQEDIALVQGDFGATCLIVSYLKSKRVKCVYATTKRNVIEKKEGDKIIKQAVFEHVQFREYE